MSKQNTSYDFGWGNPYFLLQVLSTRYQQKISPHSIMDMSYAEDGGRPELVEYIKKVIRDQMGINYRHVLITNGTTQAINILLRVYKKGGGRVYVETPELGYPFYDDMIKKSGFERKFLGGSYNLDHMKVNLIDSPSNPLGKQYNISNVDPTIWDAVYHNKVYNADMNIKPRHDVMVNSFSKMLGLTGARIGYIATQDSELYDECFQECLMENATISVPSQELILDILKKVNLGEFMRAGAYSLDRNREEFSKISYLFDNQPVQEVGMFYCANADKKAIQTLDNCGITYVRLNGDMIRLSMGQTNAITRDGVNAILKEDKK